MAQIEVTGTKSIAEYSHNSFGTTGNAGFTKFLDARLAPQIAQEGTGVTAIVREGTGATAVVREGTGTNKVARISDIGSGGGTGSGDITTAMMSALARLFQGRRNYATLYNTGMQALSYQNAAQWVAFSGGPAVDVYKHRSFVGNRRAIISFLITGSNVGTLSGIQVRFGYKGLGGAQVYATGSIVGITAESYVSRRIYARTNILERSANIGDPSVSPYAATSLQFMASTIDASELSIGFPMVEFIELEDTTSAASAYNAPYEAYDGVSFVNIPAINNLVFPW